MTAGGAAWAELVRTALVGTERAAAGAWRTVPADAPTAPLLAAVATDDAAADVLAAAAILGTYGTAGRLPPAAPRDAAEPAPSDAEDLPVVSAGAERFLSTMLAGSHGEALAEWMALAALRGRRAPAFALPALLAGATHARPLREPLRGVLGARGRWLAARNPEWAWAAIGEVPLDEGSVQSRWETGTPDERRALLEQVRRTDGARGRALVEGTWDADAPPQRAAFVAALRTGLSDADEPFLERALDDRRQEVRREAASLLAELPTSALVARMTERARAALQYQAGGLLSRARLHARPPAEHDAAMARDGVEKKPPGGIGERAWWLAQILAVVPPRTWTAAWKADAAALARLAVDGEWASVLLDGWSAAAVRHGDAEWADAMLQLPPAVAARTPLAPPRARLLAALPPERRESAVARILRGQQRDPRATELLAGLTQPWSERFAREALAWLRARASADPTSVASDDWQLRELVPALALRVPPALADEAARGWPTDDALAPTWARAVERFVALLTFRRELTEAFDR